MDSSTSPTGLNPTDHDDEEVILYIGRLQPGKDCTSNSWHPLLILRATMVTPHRQMMMLTLSTSSHLKHRKNMSHYYNQIQEDQDCSVVWVKTTPATKDSIWGCPCFFMTTSVGEKYMSNDEHDQNLMDHQHRSNHLSHHFSSRPLPCAHPGFSHMLLHKFGIYNKARPDLDVNPLEEIMKGDDSEQKESLGSILPDSIFMLMLSRRLHCLYSMLIDACKGQQPGSLVGRVLSRGKYFLSAAFAKQGASSIIKLIKKVKKSSPHATAMTRVLSTKFMDIMTHPTARDVILQCLILFPRQPNEYTSNSYISNANGFNHSFLF
ncbi:UNVERIFIED_CONTAM: hypothetical protein Sangu_2992000 [Sesamum angustifolium]|uniref:Uncharacterized protein n=1 Tax=Sesamum angustifolium TaxID=2727405 RepID=A0AAW2KM91_9LAMI